MKEIKLFALALILSVAFVGCAPDLVVKNLAVNWVAADKRAKAEIANIGNKDAGNFMVYFNGEEDPVSPNRRPQVSHNIPNLAKGNSIVLEADFAPLAHPDNHNLVNVKKIRVLVDPKNMVKEKNENNNEKEFPLP
jgi:subtilase family serine protease